MSPEVSKAVQKASPAHQKLKRDLLTILDAMEELKPRLLKLLGETTTGPEQADVPESPKPEELAIDMAAQLEARWATFQPMPRPKPQQCRLHKDLERKGLAIRNALA